MRILIVEDEELLAKSIKEVLEAENYQTDTAFDGVEGLEKILIGQYDLVILDILLPKMDGIQVLKESRKEKNTTPILLLTAKSKTEDKVKGLDTGADDYLTKPFSTAELMARIRTLLRRKSIEKTSILSVKDLQLNTATHQVTRSENNIELTAKEFSLLEFLLYNKNRILSRLSIAEHIWGDNFDLFNMTNFVDVHIKNLRKKIDHDNEDSLITTIRGVGYIIKDINEDTT
jgi:DNA-binding response OmpR family regulator